MAVLGAFFYLHRARLLASASENWLLLVLVGALGLMIAGPLDLGLGLSSLFRNDPDRPPFWSRSLYGGFGATLLVMMVWSVIFFCDMFMLYGTKVRLAERDATQHATHGDAPPDETKDHQARKYRDYIVHGSLPLLVLLFLCVLFPTNTADTARNSQGCGHTHVRRAEFLGYLIGSLVAIALAVIVHRCIYEPVHDLVHRISDEPNQETVAKTIGLATTVVQCVTRTDFHGFLHLIIFIFIFSVIFLAMGLSIPRLPAGLGICLVLNLVALAYLMTKIISPSWSLPVLGGALLLLIIANAPPYKYQYPAMGSHYESPIDLESIDARVSQGEINPMGDPKLLQDEAVLNAWAGRIRGQDGVDKPKLVLVAVTGAAYRASFWTTIVLEVLGKELPGFFDHVRLITGASGGMVGASYAVALVDGPGKADDATAMATDRLLSDCKGDSLSPVVQQLIRRDLPLAVRPAYWPQSYDRGRALEDQWKTLDLTFADLREGEEEGWRPSLVISPMVVETGRRLLFSNLDLYGLTDEQARPRDGVSVEPADRAGQPLPNKGIGRRVSRSAIEFFRAFPELKGGSEQPERNFKLKTAVRMNAAFPLVSPAVSLPVAPPRRVVDAGYYDNYGVDLATSWAFHNRDWIKENTSGLALIQIRAYRSESIRKRLWVGPRDAPPSLIERLFDRLATGLHALTTPIRGAASARQWSMSYRNDQQIQRLIEFFNREPASGQNGRVALKPTEPEAGWFESFIFENPIPFGMNWFISCAEIQRMREAMTTCAFRTAQSGEVIIDNCEQIKLLKQWWKAGQATRRCQEVAP